MSVERTITRVVVVVLLAVAGGVPSVDAAPVRGNVTLDDGDVVVVDSMAHAWPVAAQVELVRRADRSTRTTGVAAPHPGLFRSGDRVFVTYRYLAWFGKGTLQGIWTLSGSQAVSGATFKYPRVGEWAHNELIVGSSPQQALTTWDQFAPPLEFSMQIWDGANCCAGIGHQDTYGVPTRGAYVIWDGIELPEGVAYANGARMSGELSNVKFVDTYDANDANGIQRWIDSQVAFICGPDSIRVLWRFIPRVAPPSLPFFNTYYWFWASYSDDYDGKVASDGTQCDAFPAVDNWPSAWYDEPRFVMSSMTTFTAPGGPHPGLPSGSYLPPMTASSQLPRGTACGRSVGTNPGIYTGTGPGIGELPPGNGDWIKWGATQTFAGAPSMKITHVVDATWGTPIGWSGLVFANEAIADAVWGGGAGKLFPQWEARDPNVIGNWYTTSFKIETQ